MDTKIKEVAGKSKKQFKHDPNTCPVHNTKLISTYYDDLDLLLFKCREKTCTEGHKIVEAFQARKEKKRQRWLKEQADKIIEDISSESDTEQ